MLDTYVKHLTAVSRYENPSVIHKTTWVNVEGCVLGSEMRD